jgi:hypothetical protein
MLLLPSYQAVERYAYDGRCPSIRGQILQNPTRFQELMPEQYAQWVFNGCPLGEPATELDTPATAITPRPIKMKAD